MPFLLPFCSLYGNDLGSSVENSVHYCQPRLLTIMNFMFANLCISPPFLQPLQQQPRSRSRKGDCQGPGNQQHRAEHQVRSMHRSSSAENIILLLSTEVIDKNDFHFADLRIFSPVSCSLRYNKLGPDAGKEIAKALATNTTVQTIEYVRPLLKPSFYYYHPR